MLVSKMHHFYFQYEERVWNYKFKYISQELFKFPKTIKEPALKTLKLC